MRSGGRASARRCARVVCLLVLVLQSACAESTHGASGVSPSMSVSLTDSPAADAQSPRIAMQERQVIAIVDPTSPDWKITRLTCGPRDASIDQCITATLDSDRVTLIGSDPYPSKYILGPVLVDGADVAEAIAVQTKPLTGPPGWEVEFRLTVEGANKFAAATSKAVSAQSPRDQIAIIVDGRVVSAPIVQSPIRNGRGVISGNFNEQQARTLAAQLSGSA